MGIEQHFWGRGNTVEYKQRYDSGSFENVISSIQLSFQIFLAFGIPSEALLFRHWDLYVLQYTHSCVPWFTLRNGASDLLELLGSSFLLVKLVNLKGRVLGLLGG